MADLFDPPIAPSAGTAHDVDPAVILTRYGDGYESRIQNGINSTHGSATVVWNALSTADADDIITFFEDHLGVIPFDYQIPNDVTTRRWVCAPWTRTYAAPAMVTISAQFREVADL